VTRISELGTTLAVTSNWITLHSYRITWRNIPEDGIFNGTVYSSQNKGNKLRIF
jgi:hypothetical protein